MGVLAAVTVAVSATLTALVAPAAGAAPSSTTRIAGSDRYATAVALSQSAFPSGAPAVIVASGEAFPDALAAGPVAVALGGPILLTRSTSLPDVTLAEVARLRPSNIYLAGGAAAVSDNIMRTLATVAPVTRLSGSDRYGTAVALTATAFPGTAPSVWIAPGDSYTDALSAASAAARDGGVVLLAPSGALPANVVDEIARLRPGRVMVVGLTVSHQALLQVRAAGFNVRRLGGVGPFATALLTALDRSTSAPSVYLATTSSFADALAAIPAATRAGAPVLLSEQHCLPDTIGRALERFGTARLTLVGGTAALGDAVVSRTSCGPEGIFVQTVSYRAIYSVPAGVTADPAIPAAIAHTVELTEDWFAAQTGGWRPRFDRDSTGAVIVDTVQLSATESTQPAVEAIFARSMVPLGTATVVWHEGPSERDACGTSFERLNSIVMWMPQCNIYPRSTTSAFPFGATYLLAHELTHSLGAVEPCAPHYDGTSHANDDPRDVIYEGQQSRRWDALTLDPGRDDYYLHGRADCPDIADSARWEWDRS